CLIWAVQRLWMNEVRSFPRTSICVRKEKSAAPQVWQRASYSAAASPKCVAYPHGTETDGVCNGSSAAPAERSMASQRSVVCVVMAIHGGACGRTWSGCERFGNFNARILRRTDQNAGAVRLNKSGNLRCIAHVDQPQAFYGLGRQRTEQADLGPFHRPGNLRGRDGIILAQLANL